jgi:hypothetical protein
MTEIWKDIQGYEGLYQVSNLGRVKSLERWVQNHGKMQHHPEKIKEPSRKEKGYRTTQLYKEGKVQNVYVHRLVAEAFVANPDGKETVNHINGNKDDNRAENLEWNTYTENNNHAYKTGLNDETHRRNRKGSFLVEQYDENMNLIKTYPSIREAERQTGIDSRSISLGIRKGWKYGGFVWKKAS